MEEAAQGVMLNRAKRPEEEKRHQRLSSEVVSDASKPVGNPPDRFLPGDPLKLG
jgi:hypothetical protein